MILIYNISFKAQNDYLIVSIYRDKIIFQSYLNSHFHNRFVIYKIQIDRQPSVLMRDGIELALVVVRTDLVENYLTIMSYNS